MKADNYVDDMISYMELIKKNSTISLSVRKAAINAKIGLMKLKLAIEEWRNEIEKNLSK